MIVRRKRNELELNYLFEEFNIKYMIKMSSRLGKNRVTDYFYYWIITGEYIFK